MKPYFETELGKLYCGDVLDVLRQLPDESAQTCVTSPPYWGLRDYGVGGQIGLEKTPEEYVAKMVDVFREVRRVLRGDGTVWLNLGSSYAGSNQGRMADGTQVGGEKQMTNKGSVTIYSGGKNPNRSRPVQHERSCDSDGTERQLLGIISPPCSTMSSSNPKI